VARQSNCRFLRYMKPVIEALQKLGHSARPKQVVNAVQQTIDVPAEDLERKTKSGQSIFENDVHWCRHYLVKAGFIDSSKRGVWTLTAKGRSAIFTDQLSSEIFHGVQQLSRETGQAELVAELNREDIQEVEEEVEDTEYIAETLEQLKKLSPSGFEHFCQELLYESGFEDVEVTGRSGDRGIDGRGILKVNPLFSMKVAFQAKRYQDTVGSGVIRDFRGAVAGRADRGLLITTGTFTHEAEIEATRDGATHIELIDGPAIVNLMCEYQFGLKSVLTYRLDHKFFDKYEASPEAVAAK
jgi:restriction system protein